MTVIRKKNPILRGAVKARTSMDRVVRFGWKDKEQV